MMISPLGVYSVRSWDDFRELLMAFVCHKEHAMLDRRVEIDLFLTPPFYWISKLERVHNWSERC